MKDKGSILIVADAPETAERLTEILRGAGAPVRSAAGVDPALASAAAHPPELILLDESLAGADGFDGLRKLLAGEATRDVPILLLGATGKTTDTVEGLALGAADFVPKPIRKEELLARVRTYLELSRARQKLRKQTAEHARIKEQLAVNTARLERSGKAQRESEERYRQLFQHTSSGFALHEIIVDSEGKPSDYRFLDVNPAFTRLTGLKAKELIGRTCMEVAPHTERQRIEAYGRVALTGEPAEFETYNRELDRHYSITAYSPEHGQFATIFHDVTDRKKVEEERRKLERKVPHAQRLESLGGIAGGIAHDFNNILMSVLGHAELALVHLSPVSPARDSLVEITTAARHAADLCRQVLTYSGKPSGPLAKIDLRELVREMEHLLKTAIPKKADLNVGFGKGLLPIEGDPGQIRQILMNLVINASEAIGDRNGSIGISVGATRRDREPRASTGPGDGIPPGLYMHLKVTDTGCGMDARTKARIFEPFFSTKFTGRGMGLAAVLGIVRAHKGAVTVDSEPGKGTSFTVLFPAWEEKVPEETSSASADWRGRGTVLLVDDERSLCTLGARMLEHLGFDVITASDGREAVEVYRERSKGIDLVLMDLAMPNMDGGEALGELQRINPAVCVILASGYSRDDVAGRYEGKNLSGVLQKPYTLAKLTEVLSGVMPAAEA